MKMKFQPIITLLLNILSFIINCLCLQRTSLVGKLDINVIMKFMNNLLSLVSNKWKKEIIRKEDNKNIVIENAYFIINNNDDKVIIEMPNKKGVKYSKKKKKKLKKKKKVYKTKFYQIYTCINYN